jgi:hypothetical protein
MANQSINQLLNSVTRKGRKKKKIRVKEKMFIDDGKGGNQLDATMTL